MPGRYPSLLLLQQLQLQLLVLLLLRTAAATAAAAAAAAAAIQNRNQIRTPQQKNAFSALLAKQEIKPTPETPRHD